MNDRYILLIASIAQANQTIIAVFVFAWCALLAYLVLGWNPEVLRKPMRVLYLAVMLFIFLTVLFYKPA